MPLLKRKMFQKAKMPEMLKDDQEVFYCEQTKEIFKSYEEYFERVMLTSSIIWQCEMTGRPNLTYAEALASEKAARKILRTFPKAVKGPLILIASQTKRSALSELVDDVYTYIKDHFFKNEEIDVMNETGRGCRFCKIVETVNPYADKDTPSTSPNKTPDPAKIKYKVQAIDDDLKPQVWIVKGEQLRRDKSLITKEKTKLFLKQNVELIDGMLKIKPESLKKYVQEANVAMTDVFIGKVPDFQLSKRLLDLKEKKERQSEGSKKEKSGDDKNKKTQKKKSTSSKQGDITKYLNTSSGNSKELTAEEKKKREENAKKLKEDMERLRKEKAEMEAERLKKLAEERAQLLAKTQAMVREHNQIRDDLELTDHRVIPAGKPVQSMIGNKHFGEFMQILEFLHSFPEVLSIKDKFPQGVTMDLLERALILRETNGPLSDIFQVLLSTIFSLQIEEENETPINYRVNGDFPPKHPKYETMRISTKVHRWCEKHYQTKVNELVMDSLTVSELLRLHLLASGSILDDSGSKYRFQQRGGYQSSDDPGLDFCQKFPHILRALKQYTVFHLSMSDIIRLLRCLIDQILTYSSVREIIEDRLEMSTKAKYDYRMMKAAEKRRELKVNEEKKTLREELKQKIAAFEGTPEQKEELTKTGEIELEEKISKIDQKSQKEKEKYLKDLNDCVTKFFDHQSFMGSDRAFRNYYMFESLPGLFVEHDIKFSGKCLDEFVKNNPGLANCTNEQRYAFIKQMVLNDNKTDDKENKISNNKSSEKDENPKLNGTQGSVKKDMDLITQKDLLMCSADPKNCIVHTPNHPDRVVWMYYNTEEEINALINSLNTRGYREKSLVDNLISEKDLILDYIKNCPEEKLQIKSDEKEAKMDEIIRKYIKKYDYANMDLEPGTDPTTIFDAILRENLLEFEFKVALGCFGQIKVSDRMEWRKFIENFDYQSLCDELVWGTRSLTRNGLTNGHHEENGHDEELDEEEVEEEEEEEEIDEIEPGLELGNTTILDSEESSDEEYSFHDSDALRDKVKSLASALLQIEQGIDAKFVRQPFGTKKELKDKNAMNRALLSCKKRLLRWENSLMNSTSLSQVFLHYNILYDSISWSKSAQKIGCMVCRRKNDPEQTLLCDDCNKAWHMYCLKPKLKQIPEGEWYCPKCKPEDYKVKRTRKQRKIFVEEAEEDEIEESFNEPAVDDSYKVRRSGRKRKMHEDEDDADENETTLDESKNDGHKTRRSNRKRKLRHEDADDDVDESMNGTSDDYKLRRSGRKRKMVEEDEDYDDTMNDTTLNESAMNSDAEEQLCSVCGFGGELAQCLSCSQTCHPECAKPPIRKANKNWICSECKPQKPAKRSRC